MKILIAIVMSFLLASNVAVAKKDKPPKPTKAPEISVASGGGSAIALLTGVLLLVGERSRTRRA